MPTENKALRVYVTQNEHDKFKVLAAQANMDVSSYIKVEILGLENVETKILKKQGVSKHG